MIIIIFESNCFYSKSHQGCCEEKAKGQLQTKGKLEVRSCAMSFQICKFVKQNREYCLIENHNEKHGDVD